VTLLREWFTTRRPAAPDEIRERLEDFASAAEASVPPGALLIAMGMAEMGAARAQPGPVRVSAYHLLLSDALITYAAEAALDEVDPVDALGRVLSRVVEPLE